ncbi:MAG: response regulator [Planctomycetes bacterium]|nr:response regulator [Planctomycetota bacterium]
MGDHVSFLLVEDNDDHAELVHQSFSVPGLAGQLDRVASAEEALAYLRGEPPFADRQLPGVILLDINLPGMNGIELLEVIKSDPVWRTIPVVMLTTSGSDADRQSAYHQHANSYVVKPVDFERIDELLQEIGLYWSLRNRGPR